MNLKTNHYLLILITILAFTACKQPAEKTDNNQSILNKEDSMKIAFYDKYFGISDSLVGNPKSNRAVKPDSADLCLDYYNTIRKGKDTSKISKMLITDAVSFNFSDLTNWLKNNMDIANTEEIRICFGVNTNKYISTYDPINLSEKKDKLTVFLWPYKNNKPATRQKVDKSGNRQDELIEPFNIGELHP